MRKSVLLCALLATSAVLSAMGAPEAKVASAEFTSTPSPQTIADMIRTYSASQVKLTMADGTTRTVALEYKSLYTTDQSFALKDSQGQLVSAGSPLNAKGEVIADVSVSPSVSYISDAPDANSFVQVDGKLYLFSHFEYDTLDASGKSAYGKVSASIAVTELTQGADGTLKVKGLRKVDFAGVHGLWIPCNGSLSPWNTHLASEEYEPDARWFESETGDPTKDSTNVRAFVKLFSGDPSGANPYDYGWTPEVSLKGDVLKAVKHYSMGRFSKELALVAGDSRTVYFGDDGVNAMLFMYVADKAADLSAGSLYAASVEQGKVADYPSGSLTWIKLGHSTDAEIRTFLEQGLKFSDLFETSATPAEGFTAIKQYSFAARDKLGVEYLKVKAGMETAAAFLESRRYGALLGACSEWNKMEGLAINNLDKRLYVAISDQSKGMESSKTDPANQLSFTKVSSGAVYEFVLSEGELSPYQAIGFRTLLQGQDLAVGDAFGNRANVDRIANPDNLAYSPALRTLFIGEDSGMHTNNFVWAYSLESEKLVRILSVPAGAEATGLSVVEKAGKFAYLTSNYQHPGDEITDNVRFPITAVSKDELLAALSAGPSINVKGGVGYLAGLPALK